MNQIGCTAEDRRFWESQGLKMNQYLQYGSRVCPNCLENALTVMQMRKEQPATFVSKIRPVQIAQPTSAIQTQPIVIQQSPIEFQRPA